LDVVNFKFGKGKQFRWDITTIILMVGPFLTTGKSPEKTILPEVGTIAINPAYCSCRREEKD